MHERTIRSYPSGPNGASYKSNNLASSTLLLLSINNSLPRCLLEEHLLDTSQEAVTATLPPLTSPSKRRWRRRGVGLVLFHFNINNPIRRSYRSRRKSKERLDAPNKQLAVCLFYLHAAKTLYGQRVCMKNFASLCKSPSLDLSASHLCLEMVSGPEARSSVVGHPLTLQPMKAPSAVSPHPSPLRPAHLLSPSE